MKKIAVNLISLLWIVQVIAAEDIEFLPVQTDLFATAGGQTNAWGDYDNDGDLDLIVLFLDAPARLYRNDDGHFVNVGTQLGLPTDGGNARSVAWNDYDNDGDLDVYIGYSSREAPTNRLFRNDLESGEAGFTDVSISTGVVLQAFTRQVSFVDYDADGDVDLYVALRAGINKLYRNDNGRFTDVTTETGIGEPRRTVGACWFDMDADGDLDLFTTNQNGDSDGMFRNDGGYFIDVASELGIDQSGRSDEDGSVGCAVTDYDVDGDLDLYVAEYGYDSLYRNNGDGSFTDVADQLGLANHDHIVTGVWADVQHDGLPDLYTVGYVNGAPGTQDYLFINLGDRFEDSLPSVIAANDTDHGIQWADYDQDGDLDLALAANDPAGSHYLFQNMLSADIAERSIQVLVLDEHGHYTQAGAEVRIFESGTDNLLGLRMVDTGSGYNSQNAKPVHIGFAGNTASSVDVHVTVMTTEGRKTEEFTGIDWQAISGKPFVVRVSR